MLFRSGHTWWDICDCDECKEESIDDDDQPRRRKKKSLQQSLKERYEAGDPEVDLLGEPSGKFDYYVFYPRTKKQKPQSSPPPCKELKPKQDPNHEPKPLLIPYYQNILPQLHIYHPPPFTQTQTQNPLPYYTIDSPSSSYDQDFPPLENFDHP